MPLFTKQRVIRVILAAVGVLVVGIVVLIASTGWLDQLGAEATGERLARIQRSPNFRDGSFQNPGHSTAVLNPGFKGVAKMMRDWLGGHEQRTPPGPMPIVNLTRADFEKPPASGLRATWLGHSTVLVEIDGARILFDPVGSPGTELEFAL